MLTPEKLSLSASEDVECIVEGLREHVQKPLMEEIQRLDTALHILRERMEALEGTYTQLGCPHIANLEAAIERHERFASQLRENLRVAVAKDVRC